MSTQTSTNNLPTVTRINTQERTEEDWERLIEQMNALDDP